MNILKPQDSVLQVRGHLAAKIDPLNINNMSEENAKKLIFRSLDSDFQEQHMDTVFRLPTTTFIGGKVWEFQTNFLSGF